MSKPITISKEQVSNAGGVVILPIKEYRRLVEQCRPTYYLTGKSAEEVDALVEEGLKEYQDGKSIKASSITEAFKIYKKRGQNRS